MTLLEKLAQVGLNVDQSLGIDYSAGLMPTAAGLAGQAIRGAATTGFYADKLVGNATNAFLCSSKKYELGGLPDLSQTMPILRKHAFSKRAVKKGIFGFGLAAACYASLM